MTIERRRELREFLINARSRLQPENVGLPLTGRRRVAGLRRGEVAELLGVSADWYRWLESGRSVQVSQQLLARLALALRLEPHDEVTLYRLALPGLYQAACKVRDGRSPPASIGTPIDSPAEIESARRMLAAMREKFLAGGLPGAGHARPRILKSWQRCHASGVDAGLRTAQYAIDSDAEMQVIREANERLLDAARPVVAHLAQTLSTTGYAVVVSDASGCILEIVGDLDVRRRLSRILFEPGADWGEPTAGTNAIGTVLADQRPIQLMAAEHFCDGWQDLTCTAAPIREPNSARIAGVLDVTGDYRLVRPHLVTLLIESALEIEEQMALQQPRRNRLG
jgi:transcriptional regulator with XRE-family HTH domain